MLLLLVLMASVLAFAACGGGENGGGGEIRPTQEFTSGNLDDACFEFGEERDRLDADVQAATSGQQTARALREDSDALDRFVARIDELAVADDEKGTFDRFVSKNESQANLLRQAADAAEDGDSASLDEVIVLFEQASADADDAARDYGALECVTAVEAGEDADRAKVVEEGDRICVQVTEEAGVIGVVPGAGLFGEYRRFAHESQAVIDETASRLAELDPPPEGRDAFEAYLKSLKETSDLLGELAEAARRRDGPGTDRLFERLDELNVQAHTHAQEYGFRRCSA